MIFRLGAGLKIFSSTLHRLARGNTFQTGEVQEYGEPLEAGIQVYALEGDRRGEAARDPAARREAGRRVLGAYRDRMDLSDFPSFLREKCAVRSVAFAGPEAFFQERMLAYVEKTWDQWLGPLVRGLPPFDTVIGELRPQVASLVRADR